MQRGDLFMSGTEVSRAFLSVLQSSIKLIQNHLGVMILGEERERFDCNYNLSDSDWFT